MTLLKSWTSRLALQPCSQHHKLKAPYYDDLEVILKWSVVTYFKELTRLLRAEKIRDKYRDSMYAIWMWNRKNPKVKRDYNFMTRLKLLDTVSFLLPVLIFSFAINFNVIPFNAFTWLSRVVSLLFWNWSLLCIYHHYSACCLSRSPKVQSSF